MSSDARKTCAHGIEVGDICYQCEIAKHLPRNYIVINPPEREREFEMAAEIDHETQRKERRAKWVRENVATMRVGGFYENCFDVAEQMADELEKRGYL